MMTCLMLFKQWHRWREELKDRRKKQWEKMFQGISYITCQKIC